MRSTISSHSDFLSEYNAALAHLDGERLQLPSNPGKGSLSWLCREYFQSREWHGFSELTKRGKRGVLEAICQQHGDKPFALMEARHVKQIRDEKKTAGAANKRLKILRRLLQWAVEEELLSRNPAASVPRIRSKSTGYHSWTVDEVKQFEKAHPTGTRPRLALALLLYTGARRSDVVRMGPAMVKDGWLSFVTDKTGAEVTIPISPELQKHINLCDRSASTYLQTAQGRPYTAAGFGNAFRDWCDAAGLHDCSAHGLRKAGAALAAERGATEAELNAIFGWGHGSKEASTYIKAANRKVLAGRAAQLISVPRN